jgi:hypothetical protein
MTVAETSEIAFAARKKELAKDEQYIFALLEEIGPANDLRLLEAANQKSAKNLNGNTKKWHINQITGRRHGCCLKGWVALKGLYRRSPTRPGGTVYRIWSVWNETREPAGDWVRLSDEEVAAMHAEQSEKQENKKRLQVSKLKQVFSPSDFGRALVALRYAKKMQRPVATAQLNLFA